MIHKEFDFDCGDMIKLVMCDLESSESLELDKYLDNSDIDLCKMFKMD